MCIAQKPECQAKAAEALIAPIAASEPDPVLLCLQTVQGNFGYVHGDAAWSAGPQTPQDWAEAFPLAPQLIAERPASVRLTRSIPKPHKQLLKQQLAFEGYRIGELYSRRTRRATAVNWLLAWLADRGDPLPDAGPMAPELAAPSDPVSGHPGDPPVG